MNRVSFSWLAGIVCLAGNCGAQAMRYEFPLTGAQEVPPVVTTGSAQATVVLDPLTATAEVYCTFASLSADITGAHIHTGSAGSNGPVVAALTPTPGSTGQIAQAQISLSQAAVQAILAGNAYVNLHTATNPAGEVRGQIVAQPACNRVRWLSSTQATFGTVANVALGQAHLQSVGGCQLMVTDIGSSNADGVRLDLPPNTRFSVGTFSCPNMQASRQGSKATMRALDASGAPIAVTTIENIDGTNEQIDFDWSPLGVTRYTVELSYHGSVIGRFTGLQQARLQQAAGDWEEIN
ncbi:MAG: CHRD domain-containing protein [Planctomycetota bacterium]